MDLHLLALFSGMFGLFCVGREIGIVYRTRRIRIRNLFLMMYGLTYGVVLSILLILYNCGMYYTSGYYLRFDYSPNGLMYTWWWFFAAVIGYAAFCFAGMLRINPRKIIQTINTTPVEVDYFLNLLQITSIICLLIGGISFVIWVQGWGGYANLFLNAQGIRNGNYGIRSSVSFFAKPAHVVATVSMISIYLIKQKKNIRSNIAIFVISFILSLMYYLAKDGRMVMAMYFLIVFFMWFEMFEKQKNIKRKIGRLCLIFIIFIVIVLNMDNVTYILRFGVSRVADASSVVESIMDELSYIYVTGQTTINQYITNGSPLLIGHDIASALFAWVPSSLTPKGLINIWHYNTNLIAGANAVAQYPSDLISTSIYDLGMLGPFILPAIWGVVISYLDRIKARSSSPIYIVLYYSLSMTLIRGVNYSMLSSTVSSVFHLFVAAVVFWMVGKIKWKT